MELHKYTKTISIESLLPKKWVGDDGKMGVMQSVYACLSFSPTRLNRPYLLGMIDEVCYVVLESELPYTKAVLEFKGPSATTPLFEIKIEQKRTPRSTYILFFTKYREGGIINESVALSKMESARGLINSLEGHNATYLHMYDQILLIPNGIVAAFSPVIINPRSFPQPFQNIGRVPAVSAGLSGLEFNLRSKVLLALRWFDKADRETAPIDAFLNIWFALEVLAMPDTANIKPLNTILAKIYGKSYEDAVAFFKIGRLAGLRADIVHNGAMRSIHQQLTNYMRAIFVDVLFYITNQASEHRAEAVLSDSAFPLQNWLP